MPVVLRKNGLAYFPAHKCASTSVKHVLAQIDDDYPARKAALEASGKHSIHQAFPSERSFRKVTETADQPLFKFAVVREPVSRFVSLYKFLVHSQKVFERPRTKASLAEQGLSATPSFSEFLANLDEYKASRQMARSHCVPLQKALGTDPDYYDCLIDISRIKDLPDILSRQVGIDVTPVVSNSTSAVAISVKPTAKEMKRIKELYASDYEIFGPHFSS